MLLPGVLSTGVGGARLTLVAYFTYLAKSASNTLTAVSDGSAGELLDLAAQPHMKVVETTFLNGDDLVTEVRRAYRHELHKPNVVFHAIMDRSLGGDVGINFTSEYNSLFIQGVSHGIASTWNRLHPNRSLHVGDRVAEVNGVHGPVEELTTACDKRTPLNMTILRVPNGPLSRARPIKYFRVMLDRTSGQGFGVYCTIDDSSLLITGINGGLFGKWNEMNPSMAIRPGDRIVAVNNVFGDGGLLLKESNKKEVLEIQLLKGRAPTETEKIDEDVDLGDVGQIAWMEVTTNTPTTTDVDTPTSSSIRNIPGGHVEQVKPQTTSEVPPTTRTSMPKPVSTSRFVRGLKAQFFYFLNEKINYPHVTREKLARFMTGRPDVVRVDPEVYYPLTLYGWPGIGVTTNFAARWEGQLLIGKSGIYTFELKSDDGSALFIDDSPVIGHDGHPAFDQHDWQMEPLRWRWLKSGAHDINITYFNTVLHAGIIAQYKGPDTDDQMMTIPAYALQTSSATLPQELLRGAAYLRRYVRSEVGSSITSRQSITSLLSVVLVVLTVSGLVFAFSVKFSSPSRRRKNLPDIRQILSADVLERIPINDYIAS